MLMCSSRELGKYRTENCLGEVLHMIFKVLMNFFRFNEGGK